MICQSCGSDDVIVTSALVTCMNVSCGKEFSRIHASVVSVLRKRVSELPLALLEAVEEIIQQERLRQDAEAESTGSRDPDAHLFMQMRNGAGTIQLEHHVLVFTSGEEGKEVVERFQFNPEVFLREHSNAMVRGVRYEDPSAEIALTFEIGEPPDTFFVIWTKGGSRGELDIQEVSRFKSDLQTIQDVVGTLDSQLPNPSIG